MTTLYQAPTTTKFNVTFYYAAESWEDMYTDDEEIDYDNQPTDEITVTLTLPSSATPYEVYEAADVAIKGPEEDDEVDSWDGDGLSIEFNDKEYRFEFNDPTLTREAAWDKLQTY